MRKRLEEFGVRIGRFERGKKNLITDVPGVLVGNYTLVSDEEGIIRTGITAVLPHPGNLYEDRVFAGLFVMNGYGKSCGLVQIEELGLLESPILVTSTFNVGRVWDGLLEYVLERNPGARSVNPVVLECNDSRVSESERRPLGRNEVFKSLEVASESFELGNVGAGTGMVTFGYKGGLGSSSRTVGGYTVGALVVSNFGREEDLGGSIIVIIATNAPLVPNQLRRLSRRGAVGIHRAGGRVTHSSGDIVLSFSTAFKVPRKGRISLEYIPDDDPIFQDLLDAAVDSTEEAIYDALLCAEDMPGRDSKVWKAVDPEVILRKLSGGLI